MIPDFRRDKDPLGTVHMRSEGAPIHPDDTECSLTDEAYKKQLDAYNEFYGIKK